MPRLRGKVDISGLDGPGAAIRRRRFGGAGALGKEAYSARYPDMQKQEGSASNGWPLHVS